MRIVNRHNIPTTIASAIEHYNQPSLLRDKTLRVSQLIAPPQIIQLESRHDSEITQDCSDMIWPLLGSSMHKILELADTRNALSEESLSIQMGGWTITGHPDLLDANGVLSDYKITSAYSFLLGPKPEWEQQLNCYAYMYECWNFEVKSLQIVAILRDWMVSKSRASASYPNRPIHIERIPRWSREKTLGYLEERVALHQKNVTLADAELEPCTPTERWTRPDSYAVKNPKNKQAFRVFQGEEQADTLAKEKGMIVEYRPGQSIRCDSYCSVSNWCSQLREERNQKNGNGKRKTSV